jgi:hypothetical protein
MSRNHGQDDGSFAGARLGRYEIIGPLGAGGMGEVYRARDTEFEGNVALKVLPTRGEPGSRGNGPLPIRGAVTLSMLWGRYRCTYLESQ